MIEVKNDSVLLSIDSNKQYDLPFLWLRDNCQCDECRITETQEKQLLLHSVPVDIVPTSVIEKDNNILITWPDKHESIIPIDKIKESEISRYPKHQSWPANFQPNKFDWSDFLDDQAVCIEGLKDFVTYGVIILSNAPQESNSLELLSKRFGPLHET